MASITINHIKYKLQNLSYENYETMTILEARRIKISILGAVCIIKNKGDCKCKRDFYEVCHIKEADCPWSITRRDNDSISGNTYGYNRAIKYLYKILGEQQTKELLVEVLI